MSNCLVARVLCVLSVLGLGQIGCGWNDRDQIEGCVEDRDYDDLGYRRQRKEVRSVIERLMNEPPGDLESEIWVFPSFGITKHIRVYGGEGPYVATMYLVWEAHRVRELTVPARCEHLVQHGQFAICAVESPPDNVLAYELSLAGLDSLVKPSDAKETLFADGTSVFIEHTTNGRRSSYRFGNPRFHEYPEAKVGSAIFDLVDEWFSFYEMMERISHQSSDKRSQLNL